MRNWKAYVQEQLELSGLKREERIIDELADQLEEFHREALERGSSHHDADAYARAQVKDWRSFESDIHRADRLNRTGSLDRWQQRTENTNPFKGGWGMIWTDMQKDIIYGFRALGRNPGFAVVAILTLALGIGANTAIFSVVNAVLLQPLPYPEPERLVRSAGQDSYPDIQDWRAQSETVESFGGFMNLLFDLTAGPEPERVSGGNVMGDLFETFGVEPLLGRVLREEDGRGSGERVAVISYELWQRAFGGDEQILGKPISVQGNPHSIVGVMPSGFKMSNRNVQVWWPMSEDDPVALARGAHTFVAFGRLKPGVPLAEAQAEMDVIAERLEAQYPDINTGVRYTLVPLLDSVVGRSGQALWILFGAVSIVLLIACVNVANLILVRTGARQQETAIRMALGASRRRLVRQWLTETMLLFVAGGVAGVALAYFLLPSLVALSPQNLPRLDEVSLDWRVLGFTLGLSLLAGAVFGLQPAWNAGRVDVVNSLRDGGRTSPGRRRRWFTSAMIVTEVALALVLLTGAGLLVRTFSHLLSQSPGFNTERLMTFSFSLSQEQYKDIPRRTRFFEDVIERFDKLPGVESVSAATDMPFYPRYYLDHNFIIEGRPEVPLGETPSLVTRSVNPDYHRAMGVPLLKGRYLSSQDRADTFPVGLINEAAVKRFFPDEEPIGKRFRWAFADEIRWITIVGVVGDVRDFGLHAEDRPASYSPYAQEGNWWRSWMLFAVRTNTSNTPLMSAIKAAVVEVDPTVAVADFWSMDKLLGDSYALQRFSLQLLGGFAVVALLLTVIGIYGVISQSTNQRTHEIGLRLALGARRVDVLRLIIMHGVKLTVGGLLLGAAGAFAATRLIQGLLFGVSATDPLTFIAVATLLVAVAALACYIPARRAAKVDPMVALRYE